MDWSTWYSFQNVCKRLESLLSQDFGIHWSPTEASKASEAKGGREGISDLQLSQAMSQIKEDRRRDHIKDVGYLFGLFQQRHLLMVFYSWPNFGNNVGRKWMNYFNWTIKASGNSSLNFSEILNNCQEFSVILWKY